MPSLFPAWGGACSLADSRGTPAFSFHLPSLLRTSLSPTPSVGHFCTGPGDLIGQESLLSAGSQGRGYWLRVKSISSVGCDFIPQAGQGEVLSRVALASCWPGPLSVMMGVGQWEGLEGGRLTSPLQTVSLTHSWPASVPSCRTDNPGMHLLYNKHTEPQHTPPSLSYVPALASHVFLEWFSCQPFTY